MTDVGTALRELLRQRVTGPTFEVGQIEDHHDLMEDLGADGFDVIELVLAVELRFDIDFVPADFKSIATVGEFTRLIEGKLQLQEGRMT